jgi:hypothetical protein
MQPPELILAGLFPPATEEIATVDGFSMTFVGSQN